MPCSTSVPPLTLRTTITYWSICLNLLVILTDRTLLRFHSFLSDYSLSVLSLGLLACASSCQGSSFISQDLLYLVFFHSARGLLVVPHMHVVIAQSSSFAYLGSTNGNSLPHKCSLWMLDLELPLTISGQ